MRALVIALMLVAPVASANLKTNCLTKAWRRMTVPYRHTNKLIKEVDRGRVTMLQKDASKFIDNEILGAGTLGQANQKLRQSRTCAKVQVLSPVVGALLTSFLGNPWPGLVLGKATGLLAGQTGRRARAEGVGLVARSNHLGESNIDISPELVAYARPRLQKALSNEKKQLFKTKHKLSKRGANKQQLKSTARFHESQIEALDSLLRALGE